MKNRLARRYIPQVSAAAMALNMLSPVPALPSQNTVVLPVTGPLSMAAWAAQANSALDSITGLFNGSTAPGPGAGATPLNYQWWLDTSTTIKTLRIYDQSTWVAIGTLSTATHAWTAKGAVTSIIASSGLTGGTISSTGTGTGTFAVDIASAANLYAGAASKMLDAAGIYTPEVTVSFSATPTFDFNTFINAKMTLTANITSATFSNMKAGQSGLLHFVQDGTGGRTIPTNISSALHCPTACAMVLSTQANAEDFLPYTCISTTYCIAGTMMKRLAT